MKVPRFRIRDLLVLTLFGAVMSLVAKWQVELYHEESYWRKVRAMDMGGVRNASWSQYEAELRRATASPVSEDTESRRTNENQRP